MQTQGTLQGLALNNQRMKQNDFNMNQQQQQAEAQQQQLIKNQQLDAEAESIYKSGDMNAIAEFSIKNPGRSKAILAAKGIIDDVGVKRISDRFSNILTSSNPLETLNLEIAKGEAAGLDMTQSKQILSQNLPPKEIKKAAGMALASVDGGRFKSIQDAYKSSIGGDDLTVKQKDFKKYQELKETDPEAAEVFGAGANFVKDDKQRVFQIIDGIKVFADGTEKPLGENEKIKTPDMKASMGRRQALNVVGKAKEYQTKSVGFAMRLRDSIDGMVALETGIDGEKVDPARAALINKALGDGTIANMSLSSGEQQYMVNAKDALFAILRPETGAAITDSEMAQYGQIYLPQPGDSKGTTKLKKRKLENQFRAIRDKAPRIYDATKVIQKVEQPSRDQQQSQAAGQSASTSNLSDADLLKKYGGQ